jgi:hypothetical protein
MWDHLSPAERRELSDAANILKPANVDAAQYATQRSADYAAKNPLGGPARVFEVIADRIRAGEDYYAVLEDYDLCVRQALPANARAVAEVVLGNLPYLENLIDLRGHESGLLKDHPLPCVGYDFCLMRQAQKGADAIRAAADPTDTPQPYSEASQYRILLANTLATLPEAPQPEKHSVDFEKWLSYQPHLEDHGRIPITNERMYLVATVRAAWDAGRSSQPATQRSEQEPIAWSYIEKGVGTETLTRQPPDRVTRPQDYDITPLYAASQSETPAGGTANDAERYRWLRLECAEGAVPGRGALVEIGEWSYDTPEGLDAAIDAAMLAAAPSPDGNEEPK